MQPERIIRGDITKDGSISYWVRNDLHREDGPAIIWYEDGQIARECWYRDGQRSTVGTLTAIRYDNISRFHGECVGWKFVQDLTTFRTINKGDAIHDALRALPIPIRQEIIWHYCYQ